MRKPITKRRIDRLRARMSVGFPLLLAGAALLVVSNGRWILPLAAWLYPVLLVRYVRTAAKLWKGLAAYLSWKKGEDAIGFWRSIRDTSGDRRPLGRSPSA